MKTKFLSSLKSQLVRLFIADASLMFTIFRGIIIGLMVALFVQLLPLSSNGRLLTGIMLFILLGSLRGRWRRKNKPKSCQENDD